MLKGWLTDMQFQKGGFKTNVRVITILDCLDRYYMYGEYAIINNGMVTGYELGEIPPSRKKKSKKLNEFLSLLND